MSIACRPSASKASASRRCAATSGRSPAGAAWSCASAEPKRGRVGDQHVHPRGEARLGVGLQEAVEEGGVGLLAEAGRRDQHQRQRVHAWRCATAPPRRRRRANGRRDATALIPSSAIAARAASTSASKLASSPSGDEAVAGQVDRERRPRLRQKPMQRPPAVEVGAEAVKEHDRRALAPLQPQAMHIRRARRRSSAALRRRAAGPGRAVRIRVCSRAASRAPARAGARRALRAGAPRAPPRRERLRSSFAATTGEILPASAWAASALRQRRERRSRPRRRSSRCRRRPAARRPLRRRRSATRPRPARRPPSPPCRSRSRTASRP